MGERTSMGHQIAGGMIAAVLSIASAIALATLVYGQGLDDARAAGIGLFVLGVAVMAVVGAWRSEIDGVIVGPQDAVASVLAGTVAALAGSNTPHLGDTVIALIAVSTCGTGLSVWLLGRFGLGRLVRFLPFPVLAGFLGGIGIVLAAGAISMVGDRFAMEDVLTVDALAIWVPAGATPIACFMLRRNNRIGRIAPLVVLAVGVAAFHLGRLGAGIARPEARARGWLLGGVPDGNLLAFETFEAFANADWGAVAGQAGTLATLVILVPVAVLLHVGGFEQAFSKDFDPDAELRASGVTNLIAGIFATPAGYAKFSTTLIARDVGGPGMVPALVVAAVSVGTLVLGGAAVSFFPVFALAGILLVIAWSFIEEWLVRVRSRVSMVDWLVIVVIAGTIYLVGFLSGVLLGLVLTAATFVIQYSRVTAVRSCMTLAHRRSNVQRSSLDDQLLTAYGDRILILELQGFIFFGTAEGILSPVRDRLDEGQKIDHILVDFRHTTGIDSSAAAALVKLHRIAAENDIELSFCSIAADAFTRLAAAAESHGTAWQRAFPDLDRALEHSEALILELYGSSADHVTGFESAFGPLATSLRRWFEARPVTAGTALITEGETVSGVMVLDSGSASVFITDKKGIAVRRRRIHAGAILGEISAYLGGTATATVRMDDDGHVLVLDPERRRALEAEHPDLASSLHAAMARAIAERLVHSNEVISHLL